MNWLLLLNQYNEYIILALTFLVLISIIIQIITWSKIKKYQKKYQRLTKGIDNKNLEELMLVISEQVNKNSELLSEIEDKYQKLEKQLQSCVKTPKVIRYNAFDNMGSTLSFSLSLLDQKNDGVLLTSIYGRDESRFYAKIINSGESQQVLSSEEEDVLK